MTVALSKLGTANSVTLKGARSARKARQLLIAINQQPIAASSSPPPSLQYDYTTTTTTITILSDVRLLSANLIPYIALATATIFYAAA